MKAMEAEPRTEKQGSWVNDDANGRWRSIIDRPRW